MITRWWAPTRPSLTPDAVVLALLDPDAGDVGTALLAAHRAGAGALEAVAKAAVPSEMGIVRALATARAAFADSMVTSIAKGLGGSYAGLLVRDVLDDADQGVLDLFRAAVAKGVSPPIAVSRAGAVYGVPMRSLGLYTPLAVDPKSNPVALTDAADRALLTYFAKFAKAEQDRSVSKADPSGGDWNAREHPRGTAGRFVDAPMAMQAAPAPQVQAAPAPALEPEPKPATGRALSLLRRLGILPDVPAVATAGDPDTPPPGPSESKSTGASGARLRQMGALLDATEQPPAIAPVKAMPSRSKKVRRVRQVRQVKQAETEAAIPTSVTTHIASAPVRVKVRNELSRSPIATQVMRKLQRDEHQYTLPEPRGGLPDTDVMTPPSPRDSGTYFPLPDSIVMTLTGQTGRDLRSRFVGTGLDRRIFKIGYLTELAEPEVLNSVEAIKTAHLVTNAVLAETGFDEHPEPVVRPIQPGEMPSNTSDQEMHLARLMLKMTNGDKEAASRIILREDYYDSAITNLILPGYAEQADGSMRKVTESATVPVRDEYLIWDEALGTYEGRTQSSLQHGSIRLDPNQTYQVVGAPRLLYDPIEHIQVNRWYLSPLDEEEAQDIYDRHKEDRDYGDLDKALDPGEAAAFEQVHPRDEGGQFTDSATRVSGVAPTAHTERVSTPVPTPEPAQQARARSDRTRGRAGGIRRVRQVRQVRRTAPVAEPTTQDQGVTARPVAKPIQRSIQRQMPSNIGAIRAQILAGMQPNSDDSADVEAAIHRAAVSVRRSTLPILDDTMDYQLHSLADFARLKSQLGIHPDYDGAFEIDPHEAEHLLARQEPFDSEEVVTELAVNVNHMVKNNEGEYLGPWDNNRRAVGAGTIGTGDDAWKPVGEKIQQLFTSFPDLAEIVVDFAEPFETGKYVLYGNAKPVKPQVLIEYEAEELNLNIPVILVPIGKFHSSEMLRRRLTQFGGDMVRVQSDDGSNFNAPLFLMRLTNADVTWYQAKNEPLDPAH